MGTFTHTHLPMRQEDVQTARLRTQPPSRQQLPCGCTRSTYPLPLSPHRGAAPTSKPNSQQTGSTPPLYTQLNAGGREPRFEKKRCSSAFQSTSQQEQYSSWAPACGILVHGAAQGAVPWRLVAGPPEGRPRGGLLLAAHQGGLRWCGALSSGGGGGSCMRASPPPGCVARFVRSGHLSGHRLAHTWLRLECRIQWRSCISAWPCGVEVRGETTLGVVFGEETHPLTWLPESTEQKAQGLGLLWVEVTRWEGQHRHWSV